MADAKKWTAAQKNCIDARDGSVLVSAAAGSGKTAVLVERVLQRIADRQQPTDIDHLLIVTFTKAAAAEMKSRLAARLQVLIAERPADAHLRRQQMLLPTAQISTIDGFCTALLREYAETAGLSPRFRVVEGSEKELLQTDALEETLEIAYAAAEDDFMRLCSQLNSTRDDSHIRHAVLQVFEFIQAQAFPEKWLAENAHPEAATLPLSETCFGKRIRRYTCERLCMVISIAEKAAGAMADIPEAAAYYTRLTEDIALLRRAALTVTDPENDWDSCIRAISAAYPEKLPMKKKLSDVYIVPVKVAWEQIRDAIKDILPLYCENEKTARQDLADTQPKVQALCALVLAFSERYAAKKAEKQLVDFADLGHIVLQLLCDRETGLPTPLARELSGRYTEILLDEYQDTNDMQDTIFRMLSGKDNALFMVGDVKQSIYGFRQAMPEIFMAKKAAFAPFDGTTYPACITLGENFRSRPTVTGTVNFVCNQLMTADFCGIDYQNGEGLIPAGTFPPAEMPTELLLLDNTLPATEMSNDQLEARMLAMRIRELMKNGTVTDGDALRPVEYGDICILLRSYSTVAPTYIATLKAYGIPVNAAAKTPFFETNEVRTALAMLQTVDNPMRDISLMTLLLSPVCGFTADDCAQMRVLSRETAEKDAALYTAVTLAADPAAPLPVALRRRAAAFVNALRHYRRLAVSLPVDALLSRLLEETALLPAVSAGADGNTRVANLRALLQLARSFEQNGYRGLSGFVRQLDRLQAEKKSPITPATTGGGNAVSLLTVHGSKGLEFPVVILASLFHTFNGEAARQPLALHSEAGIGLAGHNEKDMTTYPTVSRAALGLAMHSTALAEELRILYVAMTRAKDRLILSFAKQRFAARLEKLAQLLPDTVTIDKMRLLSLNSLGDWLMLAFMRHPDAVCLRQLEESAPIVPLDSDTPLICRTFRVAELTGEEEKNAPAAAAVSVDADFAAALREKLVYRYPYLPLQRVPVKLAASELAHRETAAAFVAARRPAFLSEDGMTPAERGTAMHTFMQYADYARAAADIAAEADRLMNGGFLTAAQREVLDLQKLGRFFESPLYARMCASPRLLREYAFTVPLPVTAYDPALTDSAAAESLIVQGIADCVFEENGSLIIVDYKTDRVPNGGALAAMYARQLDIYRLALTQTLALPVRETLLYAFALGETVKVK